MLETLLCKWKIRWQLCAEFSSWQRCTFYFGENYWWSIVIHKKFGYEKFQRASRYLILYLHMKLLLPVTHTLCLVFCLCFCYNLILIFNVLLISYFLQLGWIVNASRQTQGSVKTHYFVILIVCILLWV